MPAYAIVVFVGLAVLGGLIAWAGDVIGYRLGKSRSSIFGLRPRATARLVGIILGALLPLTGLLVAMLVSPMAKTALLKLDYLTRETISLQQTNENLLQITRTLRERSAKLREDAKKAEDRALALAKRIAGLETERTELQDMVSTLRHARDNLQHETRQLRAKYQATAEELHTARANLQEVAENLEAARQNVEKLRKRNLALQEKEKELVDSVETLREKQNELTAHNEELASIIEQKNDDLAQIREDLERSRTELEARQDELEVRKAQLAIRTNQLERLDKKYEQLRRIHAGISESPVVYEAGDVLLRGIIDTAQPVDTLQTTLFEMLYLASAAAYRKGAVRGENGRAVLLVAPWPDDVSDTQPSEEEIVEYLAQQMKKLGAIDEFVVSITAFRRLFVAERDQLHVGMQAVPNLRVFAENEVVAHSIIPANAAPKDIFNTLLRLLRVDVRNRAQQAGLLPNPETQQYGQIDSDELFEVIERIEDLDYDVLVQVVATQDIHAADELTIEFE
ncbi:MAG: DUF3084 domain-containing protein, partial [Armatimonadota bacterium]